MKFSTPFCDIKWLLLRNSGVHQTNDFSRKCAVSPKKFEARDYEKVRNSPQSALWGFWLPQRVKRDFPREVFHLLTKVTRSSDLEVIKISTAQRADKRFVSHFITRRFRLQRRQLEMKRNVGAASSVFLQVFHLAQHQKKLKFMALNSR